MAQRQALRHRARNFGGAAELKVRLMVRSTCEWVKSLSGLQMSRFHTGLIERLNSVARFRRLLIQTAIVFAVLQTVIMRIGGAESRQWKVLPDTNALHDLNVMPNSIALSKALVDAAEHVLRWRLPRDADEWRPRRSRVELALRKAMGLRHLPERSPLAVRIQARHDLGDYWLTNVIFHSRSDFPVSGNLYVPKNSGGKKLPAVLCPVGHYLAAGKGAKENQILCIQLVKLGFVVLTYDAIGQGERLTQGNIHHEAGFALLPLGQTIAGWMVWDSIRALDFLQTLPQVDPERIGITGNSGGGLNSLLTAALDQRIRAAAVAGYVFEFNNWIKYGGPHCTCTYLPGLYQEMEWFEIAGLIAPRSVLMLQGDQDDIFPISGARRAGRNTEALFALLGHPRQARFDEIAGQPHAYSRPLRERTYGWMLHHLAGEGDAGPRAEDQINPLDESDPRLICDPGRAVLSGAPSVVELARRHAKRALSARDPKETRAAAQTLVERLAAPPNPDLHHLMSRSFERSQATGGFLEKVYFLSEDGLPIPGLLWYPGSQPPLPTVVIVDSRGKDAVAESAWIAPLIQRGFAVLSVDLRGRGETLGFMGNRQNNNYHFVAHSVMWGHPVAGRRAYDLKRTVDFVERRPELSLKELVMVGIGDEVLPVLLAAAADNRIRRVACGDYFSSFASQMTVAAASSREELLRIWNASAMDWGVLDNGTFRVDLGSVLPSVFPTADIPEVASLIAPRRLLYCQVRDRGPEASDFRTRFPQVLSASGAGETNWFSYHPQKQLGPELLLQWLAAER